MDDEELRSYALIIVPSASSPTGCGTRRTSNRAAARNRVPEAGVRRAGHAQGDHLPRHVAGGAGAGAGAGPQGGGAQQPDTATCGNMGAIYTDQDVVVDGDLVTGRTGGHCHLFARRSSTCWPSDRRPDERVWYDGIFTRSRSTARPAGGRAVLRRHFGFEARARDPARRQQIVFLRSGDAYLELFQAKEPLPPRARAGTARGTPGGATSPSRWTTSTPAGRDGRRGQVTLGPLDFDDFIPGWRTVWVSDPEGNIVEISQGFVDEANPPAGVAPRQTERTGGSPAKARSHGAMSE
jgi:glyoxylase I family protein